MEIIHLSAECYPVAKAGGLGDVVGALPKYQCLAGHHAKVVMPMYRTRFLYEHEWDVDFKGHGRMGGRHFEYTVIREKTNVLGFDLYLVDINGLLDREKIYGYDDDTERFLAFQLAVADWMNHWEHRPEVVHCHDHHTALFPFLLQHCYAFRQLAGIPTVLTIHNAQYQGIMSWDKISYFPGWDQWKWGLLDWNKHINPLASGVRCANRVTTVSDSYLQELRYSANGLENLFEYEKGKCVGILNGIDTEVWDAMTDPNLVKPYQLREVAEGKQANKEALCEQFGIRDPENPLFVFIGRLVGEKAADILPDAIMSMLYTHTGKLSVLVLGSGEPHVEWQLEAMNERFTGVYHAVIGYHEKLAHQLYAGADFLLMPSRVEPCGLNQMYAMRYGTIPLVRSTGGLQDTVTDIGDPEGFGIRFQHATVGDLYHAMERALNLYSDKEQMEWIRKFMMQIDHSWESTVDEYMRVYQSIQ